MDEAHEFKENINEITDDEIKDILKEALKVRIEEKKRIPRKNQLNQALVSTLGEFLACYRLMGYDLDGNPVNMTIYNEKMEKSALDNQFVEAVGAFMSGRVR